MAFGDVVDMHQIESGIDEGRNTAGGCLDDHASRRRGPAIARPDRGRRIDDHGRQAVPDHPFNQSLGGNLAALIGADRFALGKRHGLVGRRTARARLEGGDARGVDDALGSCRLGRLHDDTGSLDIRPQDFLRVRRPQPVIGGHMKYVTRAVRRRQDRAGVAHVAFDDLYAEAIEICAGRAGADERTHANSGRAKRSRHGGPDKAGGPGYEGIILVRHGQNPPLAARLTSLMAFRERGLAGLGRRLESMIFRCGASH